MEALTIGRAARAAGVGVETIRFYERRGLIERPPKPRGAGYRMYPPDMVARIQFIRQAQTLGFSLREVQELLALRTDPSADCGAVRERARTKVQQVNEKIAELERIRGALERIIAICPGRAHCRRARSSRPWPRIGGRAPGDPVLNTAWRPQHEVDDVQDRGPAL